ncbi:MAG: universal stress protein [Erythrobacter sp.]|nr:universal stress protein [Erythrobacter sp.]
MSAPIIAVATDFSARADRAIDRGWLLGSELDCTIRFLHALDIDDAETADRTELDRKMRECVGEDQSGLNVEFAYPEGNPPKAIARACEASDVSLLVVGPARYNSLGDYFLGTSVDYVLRNTTKPVLVVKNRPRTPYRQIVAGTDFSVGSAHAIITAARMFPDAAVHIVHAWHVPFQAWQQDRYVADETAQAEMEKMEDFFAELTARETQLARATTELVQGSAFQAINAGLKRDPCALVVLGSHGTSGFRQAAIGSVTSDLLRSVEADMLVVNVKDAEG